MFDQSAGGGEPGGVTGLGQNRGSTDRGQSGDGGDQVGESKVVEHGCHSVLGVGEVALVFDPVAQQQLHSFQCAAPVCDHPGRVVERDEHVARDPQRGFLTSPACDLAAHGLLEAGHPEAAGAGQIAAVAIADHAHRRYPGARSERLARGVQRGGPHAFQ
ncbi:hypothetical protein AB0E01_43870 [Nocardia vinacea]|uniref:hypothetical protein n=1 Tax=Nocardia vinacea TaxID=96468 RepID=UPI0033F93836